MADDAASYRFRLRHDTAAGWAALNPILAEGEPGVEVDTHMLKMGDGATAWNALDYTGGDGPAGPPNTLVIGTVITGAVGTPAAAEVVGDAPNQALNLTLPTGATGATGPANTLSIGTVGTGPAAATVTGAAPNQTLNLVIPQGDPGLVWRGTWAAATAYAVNDAVTNGTASYRRKIAGTTPTTPASDPTNWEVLAARGATGAAGLTWRGTWAAATAYVVNDAVTHLGSSYRRLVAGTTATAPAADAVNWTLLAQKGADGAGAGDVVGPASADADNLAAFNGTTGKIIADSGIDVADVMRLSTTQTVTGAKTFAAALTGSVGVFDGGDRVYSPTNPPPGGDSWPGTEMLFSTLAGADDDAKLLAAITAISALTLKGVTIVLDENRDYTFAAQQTIYSGFSIRGTFRPQDQARASRPIGNRILLRMTGGVKGWLKTPTGGSTFGVSVSNLSIDGDASSGLFEGNEADGTVLWTSVFRDISIQNAAFVLGSATNKLLVTACTVDGWWNINNVQDRAWQIGGSDLWINPSTMLLDSPTTIMADTEYLASMDFQQNSWWRNIYCTAEQHSGFLITGSVNSHSNWFETSVVEGRNSGAPCYGALMRFTGGSWNLRDCRFAFAMSNPTLSAHGDAGVLHFAGGTHSVTGCTYERGATAEATPFIYVSAGHVTIRDIQRAGTWTGKPVAYQTEPGLIDADDSVELVTAASASAPTGAGNVTSTAVATGTSITVDKPANTVTGDLLIAAVASRNSTAPYTTPPAGWTIINPSVDSTAPGLIRFYYKHVTDAGAEPASYTWAGASSGGRQTAMIFRVIDAENATPVDVSGAVATQISGPDRIILPSVTTTEDSTLLLALGFSSSTGGVPQTYTSTTMTVVGSVGTATGTAESALTVLQETVGGAGATGTRTVTATAGTASSGNGYLIALQSVSTPLATDRTFDAGMDFLGDLSENGERVFSPNNLPTTADISDFAAAVALLAPLADPVFTGNPTAPTPATADNDTSVATTAFVKAQGYATLAGPAFTGNPTAPTPTAGDNDTSIATTAFVVAGFEPLNRTIDVKTGAYTLVLGDAVKCIHFNHATTAASFTIPPNSTVAFPVGTYIEFTNINVADLTLAAGAGVTLNSPAGLKLTDQYATAAIRKTATDTWIVMGRTSV